MLEQAITQLRAIGANDPAEAVYVFADRDTDGAPLDASAGTAYELRFEAGDLPPLEQPGFWSVTMYKASDGLLVANPLGRYSTRISRPASSSTQTVRRRSSCPRRHPPTSPRPTGSPPPQISRSSSACGSTTRPRRSATAPDSRRRFGRSPISHDRPRTRSDAAHTPPGSRVMLGARGRSPARPRGSAQPGDAHRADGLLAGPDGRRVATRYAAGAALTLLLFASALVLFGRSISLPQEPHLDATLDLVLGALLVGLALVLRRRRPRTRAPRRPRAAMSPHTALAFGVVSMATNVTTLALLVPAGRKSRRATSAWPAARSPYRAGRAGVDPGVVAGRADRGRPWARRARPPNARRPHPPPRATADRRLPRRVRGATGAARDRSSARDLTRRMPDEAARNAWTVLRRVSGAARASARTCRRGRGCRAFVESIAMNTSAPLARERLPQLVDVDRFAGHLGAVADAIPPGVYRVGTLGEKRTCSAIAQTAAQRRSGPPTPSR